MASDEKKERLYKDFYGKVHGYFLSRINSAHDAEDLTSDVFVKVYAKFDSFDEGKASLSTWIYAISKNTLTDYFRKRRVLEELPEDLASDSSVEEKSCNAETLEELANALETLEQRERDVIILRYYTGKTLKKIADGMGISYAYVKVLQGKALEKLKKFLEKV